MIVTFILDNQLENTKTAKSILPNFTYVGPGYWQILVYFMKHEQFEFSLPVNGKSIERKVFPSIL